MSKDPQDDKHNITINYGTQFNIGGNVKNAAIGDQATYNAAPNLPSPAPGIATPVAPSDPKVPIGGVFISYSRKDIAFVEPVVQRLWQLGLTVWWDQANIPPGANWRDELESALAKSTCLLLFMTPHALESQFVKEEYRYFVNNGKKLYPIMCEPVDLPPALQGIQFVTHTKIEDVIARIHADC